MLRVRVVIQARTNSNRLPSKSLLPLAGIPLAVLSAKRAANRGHEVIVATSVSPLDDLLSATLRASGVPVFRGDLVDVRRRFLAVAADMGDDDVLVRLTADNPSPDGELIDRVVDDFVNSSLDHLETSGEHRLLPYGMSVEVFRVGVFRASISWRDLAADREHVTLALREMGRSGTSRVSSRAGLVGNLRSTIDTFEDWCKMEAVFGALRDPITASWELIISRLCVLDQKYPFSSEKRLILGTAQLTRPYGSVQPTLPPAKGEAEEILLRALTNGLWIDTARAYGDAETMIGKALKQVSPNRATVITKCQIDAKCEDEIQMARSLTNSVETSMRCLGVDQIPVLLLHDPTLLSRFSGAALAVLRELKSRGLIARIGVSVDGPATLLEALRKDEVKTVQLAFNLLDWRWSTTEVQSALASRPDVEIHCRSIFLQGILLRDSSAWPQVPGYEPSKVVTTLKDLAQRLGRKDVHSLCLAWINGKNPLDTFLTGVVVGAESITQLTDLFESFTERNLSEDEAVIINEFIPWVPEALLDPAKWPRQVA